MTAADKTPPVANIRMIVLPKAPGRLPGTRDDVRGTGDRHRWHETRIDACGPGLGSKQECTMNLPRSLFMGVILVSGIAVAQDPDTSATASPQSAEPIADGTSEFNHLDVDRDGWLSPSEVKVHPLPLPEFALMDEDADGKLSSAEWNARVELVEFEEED